MKGKYTVEVTVVENAKDNVYKWTEEANSSSDVFSAHKGENEWHFTINGEDITVPFYNVRRVKVERASGDFIDKKEAVYMGALKPKFILGQNEVKPACLDLE